LSGFFLFFLTLKNINKKQTNNKQKINRKVITRKNIYVVIILVDQTKMSLRATAGSAAISTVGVRFIEPVFRGG